MIETEKVSTDIKLNDIISIYLNTKYWTFTEYAVLYMDTNTLHCTVLYYTIN